MNHSEMDELYELYLMDALEAEQAAEIAEHLRTNCDHCRIGVKQASELLGALATVTRITPAPAHLKDKVIAIARPAAQKKSAWPYAFALATAASVALLVWGFNQQAEMKETSQALQEMRRQRNELRSAVAILSQSDTRTVNFGRAQAEPHGRVFLSSTGGVVFVAGQLPELTTGKTFELWLIPAKGNPQAAGTFQKNSQGVSVNVLAQSITPASYAAVAVTIEPEGGSAQPTSKPFLVVPLA